MEKWILTEDRNIAWIMKENLKKNRLLKMDREWFWNRQNRLVRDSVG